MSIFVRAVIIACFLFLLAPLAITLVMSFDARPYLAPFPPPALSWRWYADFFSSDYYLKGLWLSIFVSGLSTAIALLCGVSMAVLVSYTMFRGRSVILGLFMAPLVIPGVVIGFALLLFLSKIGIYDGFWRLMGGHILVAMPYTFRMTLVSLGGIPKSYVEAAMSLGANERQVFWAVTLPLAKTGITAGAIFAFAFSLDDASLSMFLSDPKSYTLPVAMLSMMRADFNLTIAAAAVFLLGLTVLVIILLEATVGLERVLGQGFYRG
jgi:putative spermidine/putrescine transport system permease protein